MTVTVQLGDTLWSLAAKHLGSAYRWPEIWQTNKNALLKTQRYGETRRARRMIGPHWIFPGTILTLPPPQPSMPK